MIKLPETWEQFSKEMFTRAKKYIDIGYWDITIQSLNLWKNNFKSDEEVFLSALIIYRIIFRNKAPRLAMYRHIIEIILPNQLKSIQLYNETTLHNFIRKIETDPWSLEFKFTTIDSVDKSPSKSGSQLLREFRRFGKFHKDMEISLSNLNDSSPNIKAIIIFDDFMGTGTQFEAFLKKYTEERAKFQLIYCPLAAHIDGIKFINEEYPDVLISPVETLDDNYSFFSQEYMPRIVEDINMDDLKLLYINIMERTKLKAKQYFGYGEKSLLYIYDMSSPNNSLPILTYNDDNWENIFTR